jgi:hypothetical protein
MTSPSEERLKRLWLKAMAASDSAEVESLLMEFRDALHEHIKQIKGRGQRGPDRNLSQALELPSPRSGASWHRKSPNPNWHGSAKSKIRLGSMKSLEVFRPQNEQNLTERPGGFTCWKARFRRVRSLTRVRRPRGQSKEGSGKRNPKRTLLKLRLISPTAAGKKIQRMPPDIR